MFRKQSTRFLIYVLLVAFCFLAGCSSESEEHVVTAEEVVSEIERLGAAVHPMPPGSADAALHALNSGDPKMRAEVAMSLSKSRHLTQSVCQQLETLAIGDSDPVVRAAALSALYEQGKPSREIVELAEQLRSDPQLSLLASRLSTKQ